MNASDKRNYLLRFHRFQKSREAFFAPKIFAALKSQYDTLLSDLNLGLTEHQAISKIDPAPIQRVLKNLYFDAATIYGAKVRSDLNRLVPRRLPNPNSFNQFKSLIEKMIECPYCHAQTPDVESGMGYIRCDNCGKAFSSNKENKEQKARMPMGFSEDMRRLIEQYFSLDILNESEGITDTTKELIRKVFTDAYAKGEGIDDIISQLKNTELSRIRARLIARTETVTSANQGALFVAKSTGLDLNKQWLSASDNRVRFHHRSVNGQTVGVDDYFNVGGYDMKVPGDHGGKDGRLPVPASEICNCRCTTVFIPID